MGGKGGEEMRGMGEGRLEGRVCQLRDKGRGWDGRSVE